MNFLLVDPSIIGQTPLCPSAGVLAVLRSPSFLPDALAAALFERHLAWWVAAAAIGAVLMFLGRSRADRRLDRIGTVALAAVALWVVAAVLLDTPGERLYTAHTGLAAAAKEGDADKVVGYFDTHFIAPQLNITSATVARDEVASRLKEYGIQETYITAYDNRRRGSTAVTAITAITKTNAYTLKSSWQLDWEDMPGSDWRIVHAELTRLNDQAIPPTQLIP
jgi:hypothetical protein